MGVRGIVVASLPGKDLRDFRASERRQRASLHPSPPFGVLVLDGTVRRPIPTPVAALLERIAGREVSLLVDPPALVFDGDRRRPADHRRRTGSASGRAPAPALEGRLVGARPGCAASSAACSSRRRSWRSTGGPPVAIPIGDLERLA